MSGKKMGRNLVVLALLALTGCATMPTGPSVMVLPARGKSLGAFQNDEIVCRQWAANSIGLSAQDTATDNTARSAALGTAIGAGAGALLGAASGNMGAGAALGAGGGLLLGTASGASSGEAYGWEAQRRYDYAYVQCMYAKGNQIPGQVHGYRIRRAATPPPPPNTDPGVPPDYVPPAD